MESSDEDGYLSDEDNNVQEDPTFQFGDKGHLIGEGTFKIPDHGITVWYRYRQRVANSWQIIIIKDDDGSMCSGFVYVDEHKNFTTNGLDLQRLDDDNRDDNLDTGIFSVHVDVFKEYLVF